MASFDSKFKKFPILDLPTTQDRRQKGRNERHPSPQKFERILFDNNFSSKFW